MISRRLVLRRLLLVSQIGLFAVITLLRTQSSRSDESWTIDDVQERRIEALFQQWNRPDSPGVAVGIARRGELVFSRGYGAAELDHRVPIQPESVVGGRDFLRLILTRGRLRDGRELDYAFGLNHGDYKGLATVSHDGQLFGYCSEFLRFPEQRLCVTVLANLGSIDVTAKAQQIADIVLELPHDRKGDDTNDEPVSRIPPDVLASHVGEFYQADSGRVWEIAFDTGRLTLKGMGEPLRLHELKTNQFGTQTNGVVVTFEADEGASARALSVEIPTATQPVRLERLERTHPEPTALAQFAGQYRSQELQTNWNLHVSEGKLAVRLADHLTHFEPLDHDRFESGLLDVAFQRDDKQRLVGFTVFSEPVSGIFFERITP